MAWSQLPPDGEGLGSEGGKILLDEDYDGCARITLEEGGGAAPFAITCGIYGWMVHTRFFGEAMEARASYDAMKPGLAQIVEMIPLQGDPNSAAKMGQASEAISAFCDANP